MILQSRKNLFELLREAEGDDQPTADVDQNTENTDDPTTTDDNGEAESTQDDDLDINVDLDDPNEAGGDDTGDDYSGDTTTTSGDESKEEVKKGNTDLFTSLTAEEQSIKIMELKKLYNDIYISIDDLIEKLNSNRALEDVDPRIITRISSQMEDLRRLLQDYIINQFPIKTYYENDVQYSIFLSMFTTIRGVFEEIYKSNERNQDKK